MVHVNPPGEGGVGIGAGGGSASGGFFSVQEQQQQQNKALGMALPGLVGSPGGPSSDDAGKKIRKPYTITKSRESWTEQEHDKFLEALQLFDRDWKKIEAFVGTKTVIQNGDGESCIRGQVYLYITCNGHAAIFFFFSFCFNQIRSHAQKYFLKVQKNGTSAHVPPPRPKRKAAHPYPQKATNNAPLLVQPIPFQASCLLEQGYALGTDSFSTPRNSSTEGTRPGGPIFVENCCVSSCESPCRSQPNCEKHNPGNQVPSLRAMPDFVQVYTFLGNVFDPSASCHLEKMKEMNPIDVETVLLLMRNLSINLTSPDFEVHMKLLSMYDSDLVEPKSASVDKLLIAN